MSEKADDRPAPSTGRSPGSSPDGRDESATWSVLSDIRLPLAPLRIDVEVVDLPGRAIEGCELVLDPELALAVRLDALDRRQRQVAGWRPARGLGHDPGRLG